MKTEHTFKNESNAREAWAELYRIGRQRNQQLTVAHLEGARVYLRPEYATPFLARELSDLAEVLK